MAQQAGPFDDEVQGELHRLKVRREAQRRLAAEDAPRTGDPELHRLDHWLAGPDVDLAYRLDGWQPRDTRCLLAAQYKAGKTTLVGNLARSLVDGDPWLGRYTVEPITGSLVVVDNEMSERHLRSWFRDQCIEHANRVHVAPLRGKVASFNILDASIRREWADWLLERDTSYFVLDCLRPCLDALGLDEHKDAGRFLVQFDALLADANITEALVVHHMGHANERARGDSRLRDWPDVEWRLVRKTSDPASDRFISAYGRDVEKPEQGLAFDRTMRRLIVSGGSRADAQTNEALDPVERALAASQTPMSQTAVEDALQGKVGRDVVRRALRAGISLGLIATEPGPRGAILHRLVRERAGVRE